MTTSFAKKTKTEGGKSLFLWLSLSQNFYCVPLNGPLLLCDFRPWWPPHQCRGWGWVQEPCLGLNQIKPHWKMKSRGGKATHWISRNAWHKLLMRQMMINVVLRMSVAKLVGKHNSSPSKEIIFFGWCSHFPFPRPLEGEFGCFGQISKFRFLQLSAKPSKKSGDLRGCCAQGP